MYRLLPSIVVFCLIALMTLSANAGERDRFKDKFHERIETLTMWRMMQALDLDTETSEKILQVRGKFLAQRKELHKSLHQSYRDLKKYLKEEQSKENDKKLAETIEKIRKTRQDLRAVWEQQFDAVAKVLPIRKQAELVIFMKDFRKELKAMLRGSEGRPPGRRMGPPPGSPGDNPGPRPERPGLPGRWDAPKGADELPGE